MHWGTAAFTAATAALIASVSRPSNVSLVVNSLTPSRWVFGYDPILTVGKLAAIFCVERHRGRRV